MIARMSKFFIVQHCSLCLNILYNYNILYIIFLYIIIISYILFILISYIIIYINILYNYFDSLIKLFLKLYLTKLSNTLKARKTVLSIGGSKNIGFVDERNRNLTLRIQTPNSGKIER